MSNRFGNLRRANEARQKEWDKDNRITLSFRGNELAGEVGEACNIIKKIERERIGLPGSRATKEQLAEELADVVICADLIAMEEGIDPMRRAVPAKFNSTSRKVGLETRLSPAMEYTAQEVSGLLLEAFNAGWTARDPLLFGGQEMHDQKFQEWRNGLASTLDVAEVEL
jgi:NTP pyrophosphatase (non-canonical NTP hydrolase)